MSTDKIVQIGLLADVFLYYSNMYHKVAMDSLFNVSFFLLQFVFTGINRYLNKVKVNYFSFYKYTFFTS